MGSTVLLVLCNTIGCAISGVAGAGLHYWMRHSICLLFDHRAGANYKFTTLITCAANSVLEMKALLYCTYKSST